MPEPTTPPVAPDSPADPGVALLNVKACPEGLGAVRASAAKAHAYHEKRPYPIYHFKNWKTEELGPLPRCLAHAQRIVEKGARFLFGKGVEITVPGNTKLEEELTRAWKKNRMPARMTALAELAAKEGGIALKFAWNPDRTPSQISIQSLSLATQVQFFYAPHDKQHLLMARVQYPYQQPNGRRMWHREEWTETLQVSYFPISEDDLGRGGDPDKHEWVESERIANPFGLIPIVHIKNVETDQPLGKGDLWELYEVIDDINLAYWHQKRCNQFDSSLNPYFIDLELDDENLKGAAKPGEPIVLNSSSEAVDGKPGPQGKVVFPSGTNDTRESLRQYARDLEKHLDDAAGAVTVDQAEFTNKGNLTAAVLEQLYAGAIELAHEKRKSFGENGIELFLEAMALGLQRHGVTLGVVEATEETWDVSVKWPRHFELSSEERTAEVGLVQEEEVAGYTTHERAIERIAQMNDVKDVAALKEELKKEPTPSPTETLSPPTGGGAGGKQIDPGKQPGG